MGNKIKKTLNNLLYGVPIIVASFLPMKEAKGQMTKIENLNMKRINRQTIKIRDPNTLYLTFQPGDLGLGVRYDRRISQFGVYSSLSRGNYKLAEEEYIKNHFKFALGGLLYLKENLFNNSTGFFSGGISYHSYGEKSYESGMINEKVFKPLSIEAGMGARKGHFGASIRFDPLKWEGSMDFGISF